MMCHTVGHPPIVERYMQCHTVGHPPDPMSQQDVPMQLVVNPVLGIVVVVLLREL